MPVILKKPAVAGTGNEKFTTVAHSGQPSFIRSGHAASQALAEEQSRADIAKEARTKPFRFSIDAKKDLGKDFTITFLDGDLDANGEINKSVWPEHAIELSGRWTNLVCLQPEYCPACAHSDKFELVAGFTITDHTPYTIQKGPKQGVVLTNQRKLYVAKRTTLAQLQKIAVSTNGLRGLQLQVSRSTDRVARVGDMFIPIQKYDDNELKQLFPPNEKGERQDLPFNYGEAAPFFTADQMKDLGLHTAMIQSTGAAKPELMSKL